MDVSAYNVSFDSNLLSILYADYVKRRDALDGENSKLRELAKILANCAAGHGCDYCPINGGHGHVDEIDMCESVHDRMHELGIEVDE